MKENIKLVILVLLKMEEKVDKVAQQLGGPT